VKKALFTRTLSSLMAILVAPVALWAEGESTEPKVALPPGFKFPDRDLYDEGKYVYEQNCVVCHGPMGDGRGEIAALTGVKPRSFRTGLFKYRSTPTGKLPTTEDLLQTVRNGRTGTAMGMFTFLNEAQLRAVVEYVKFFSRRWRHAENYAPAIALPPVPDWMSKPDEMAPHAEAGKATFQTICATCHGPAGDGKGPLSPTLKDALGEPDPPADLRQPHLRSGDEPLDIYRVLMTGLDGTPMVSFADALTAEQKWDIAAYILTIREK
jgi:mono/diheme cytochrome c family protein